MAEVRSVAQLAGKIHFLNTSGGDASAGPLLSCSKESQGPTVHGTAFHLLCKPLASLI